MYSNPFEAKSPSEIYDIFLGKVPMPQKMPRWPSEDTQRRFISRIGVGAIRYAQDYLKFMERDGAFSGNWKGLDYGCGFGRFSSLMLQYGPAKNLMMCDAMPHVEKMIQNQGFENKFCLIPQVLKSDTEMGKGYSFILAWSVFTHFNKDPFVENIRQLYNRLKIGGKIYFTVSDSDFITHFTQHWFKSSAKVFEASFRKILEEEKFLFSPTLKDEERRNFWGRAFVTDEFLQSLQLPNMEIKFLGSTDPSQKLYAITRKS